MKSKKKKQERLFQGRKTFPELLKYFLYYFAQQKDNTADEIIFRSNGVLTLGVEIELQLIDPVSFNLTSRADELLANTVHIPGIKPEFYQSTIEIVTGKNNNVHEAEADLRGTFSALRPVTDALGITFATTGCHPFAHYSDSIISPTERYQSLIDRNQWLTRRMTVYGLHVHLGMESDEDCIRFNNFFMPFIPHLLAISASSPFWQGTDTGLSSCRPTTYEALPTAGQPYRVRNWREFTHLYDTLKKCGSIHGLKDLWWDMRPSPGYGTLEIRVCDVPATLAETLAITAFIHGLAHWFKDNGSWLESISSPPPWLMRENKWRAMRYGLDAELVINTEGRLKPLREDIQEWIEKIAPYTNKLGYQDYIKTLLLICKNGTSSERQRHIYRETGSLEEVVRFNVEECARQSPHYGNS